MVVAAAAVVVMVVVAEAPILAGGRLRAPQMKLDDRGTIWEACLVRQEFLTYLSTHLLHAACGWCTAAAVSRPFSIDPTKVCATKVNGSGQ